MDRFYAGVRQGGFGYGEEGRLFDLTGVPDERIAVRVDTRAVAARKWAAILRHRSQLEEHQRIPEPLRWIVLDAECFVQAFPPRPVAAPEVAVVGSLNLDLVVRVARLPGPGETVSGEDVFRSPGANARLTPRTWRRPGRPCGRRR